jgi:hypothetical protein
MSLNYWPRIPPKQPSNGIREFRGVNKLDPYSLNTSFSPLARNLISSNFPALTVRPGFSVLGSVSGATRVLGLGIWKATELHAVFNDGTWRKWTGSTWTTLKSGLSKTAVWSFANYKGNLGNVNLVGTNGVDPMQHYDGTTVSNLATAPAGGNFIETHDNRLYCAVGLKLYFSPIGIADNWNLVEQTAADGGNFDKNTPEGESICGLKAGSGHITVFFPSSSWELYGTSSDDYTYMPVAEDIGGLNDQSIVNLGGVTYFLDETGIYAYSGGARPRKDFSLPVQWYVDNMIPSAKQTCCMGADGRYLYVAIPMASSSAPDTILVYDSLMQVWYVWDNIPAVFFAKMGDALYVADAQGRVLQLGGTTDNGAAISWEWQSKPIGAATMGQLTRVRQLVVTADKPAGSTLQVSLTDQPTADSGWKTAGTFGSELNIQSRSLPVPPSMMGNVRFFRTKLSGTGPATIYELAWDQIDMPLR